MAQCLDDCLESAPDWNLYKDNFKEQNDEILALKSFYENTDYLDIIEEAANDNENSKKFSIKAKIPIETNVKPIKIELWLPIENASESEICELENEQEQNKLILRRSISGKRAHSVINCRYLTPLTLNILLPDSYPSETKPYYMISSEILNESQLNSLSTKLDEIWNENFNMPVLYTWFEWLQQNIVNHLDLFEAPNKIILTPMGLDQYDKGEVCNQVINHERINCLFEDPQVMFFSILRYNFIEEIKEFEKTMQNCLICFDEKLGIEFHRLNGCKHHFCTDCMSSMCSLHVKEGTIQLLKCPDKDCKEYVPIDIMSKVLSKDEFDRWEKLMFQRTLDSMEDIIYCPKCSNPIIVDENNTHAFCMICNLDFCKLCKETWHTSKCLSGAEKVNEKIKSLKLNMQELLALTDDQIKARFKDASFVMKLKEKTLVTIEKEKQDQFMKKYVKCPKCKAPIDKFDGCNKVSCICGCILCYVCGKQISGYEHFQENDAKCNLWSNIIAANRIMERPRHEAQLAVERIVAVVPEQRKNLIKCPSCAQQSLKAEKNNHIKCWLCLTNFCFCCKKRIIGNITAHYKNSITCKQHSD